MSDQELTIGNFCWIDLVTPDPEGVKSFYQKVFNWKYHDQSMPDGSVYTIINAASGGRVGGLYRMYDEMVNARVPPHINNYIAVESVDDSVEKAQDLGATVRMAPFDVLDYGRMSVLIDPAGANFSLWQAKSNDCDDEMADREAHGMFCWQELLTSNVDQAEKFYSWVLGWDFDEMDVNGIDYTLIKNRGKEIGGMMLSPAEQQHIPPYWGTYITVVNLDETIDVVRENNGNIMMAPQNIPETGRFASCQAPDGTVFSLFQFAKK